MRPVDSLPSLTQVPAEVEAVDWVSKVYRTGGPSGPLYDRWELRIALRCESIDVRRVTFLDSGGRRRYSRDWARERGRDVGVRVGFWPHNWVRSDWVTVSAAIGVEAAYFSHALKTDPVGTVAVHLRVGDEMSTGVPTTVLTLPGLTVGLLLVSEVDTRSVQSRWRIRTPLAGSLGAFDFLAAGRRHGVVDQGQ